MSHCAIKRYVILMGDARTDIQYGVRHHSPDHQHDLKSVRKVIHSCFKVFMSFHKFKVFALLVKQKLTSNLNLLRSFETVLNNMLAQGTLSPWQPNHFTPQVFTL